MSPAIIHDAELAYEWLAAVQHAEGSWFNYYLPDGSIEDAKLDTNVCAYIATGVWHHWLCTWDRGFVDHLWPTVVKALDWVVSMRLPSGGILWAREVDSVPVELRVADRLVVDLACPRLRHPAGRRPR